MTSTAGSGELEGQRVLITGAASGIGAACAAAFAEVGADLVLADLADATPVAEGIATSASRPTVRQVDVSDEASVDELVSATGPFDVVVNSAGILIDGHLEDMSVAEFDKTIAVNLRGTFLVGRATLPAMRDRGHGRFIAVASELALTGRAGTSAYIASKSAVIGLVHSWALEFAPDVLVNALAPGPTDTPLLAFDELSSEMQATETPPIGRVARPGEIAAVARFLAGPAASFVTGQTISPNGGAVLH